MRKYIQEKCQYTLHFASFAEEHPEKLLTLMNTKCSEAWEKYALVFASNDDYPEKTVGEEFAERLTWKLSSDLSLREAIGRKNAPLFDDYLAPAMTAAIASPLKAKSPHISEMTATMLAWSWIKVTTRELIVASRLSNEYFTASKTAAKLHSEFQKFRFGSEKPTYDISDMNGETLHIPWAKMETLEGFQEYESACKRMREISEKYHTDDYRLPEETEKRLNDLLGRAEEICDRTTPLFFATLFHKGIASKL